MGITGARMSTMKMAAMVLVLATVLFSGCQKTPPPPPVVKGMSTPPAIVKHTPSPSPAASVRGLPSPASPASPRRVAVRQLAPEGVFYLLERIAITNDSGVIGELPGTKVTLVTGGETKMQVTDGERTFEVTPAQVTNDLGLAASARKSDETSQAAAASAASKEIDEAARKRQMEFIRSAEPGKRPKRP